MIGDEEQKVPMVVKRAEQTGFTVVELMVTIAVLGILMSIAVPAFKEMARSYQVSSKAQFWVNALNYARSESAKRGERVTLCPSSNGTSCQASSNLHVGWIAFVDANNNATVDAGEAIVTTGGAESLYTVVLSGTSNNYVSFIPNGMTKTIAGGSWNGNIKICQGVGTTGRSVVINPVGRVRVGSVGC